MCVTGPHCLVRARRPSGTYYKYAKVLRVVVTCRVESACFEPCSWPRCDRATRSRLSPHTPSDGKFAHRQLGETHACLRYLCTIFRWINRIIFCFERTFDVQSHLKHITVWFRYAHIHFFTLAVDCNFRAAATSMFQRKRY